MNPSDQEPDQERGQERGQEAPQPYQPSPVVQPPAEPVPSVPPVTPPEVPQQQPVAPQPKGSKLKKVLLTLLSVIVLAGIAFAVYVFWPTTTASESGASTKTTKHDIAQINVGVASGQIGLYPKGGTDSYIQSINSQVFESLVQYQDETKLVPLLSTGWSNPNNDTWVFNLKHNIKFHDGNAMTAADVVYSLKLAAADEDLSTSYAATIKDVRALDNYKVEVTTKQTDPFFLNRLSFLKVLDAKKPTVADGSNGTGPYQVKTGTTPSDSTIELTAFDGYHGGHVYTRALKYVVEDDEAALSRDLAAGKIQFAGEFSSAKPANVTAADYTTWTIDDPAVTYLPLNSVATGPLQKLPVREALRDSIDVPLLIKDLGIDAQPASQLMTKTIPGYNESLKVPKQDIPKAKTLLASAGYPNGVTLTLTAQTSNLKVAEEVAKQAKAAGFTINIKEEPSFGTFIDALIAGKTEMATISYSSDVFDGSDVFAQVLQQTGNYKSATLDSYLTQADATLDQADRLSILQKTSKYVYDDVAAIPLFNRQRTWLTAPNYHLQFDTHTATPGVYFWQAYSTR